MPKFLNILLRILLIIPGIVSCTIAEFTNLKYMYIVSTLWFLGTLFIIRKFLFNNEEKNAWGEAKAKQDETINEVKEKIMNPKENIIKPLEKLTANKLKTFLNKADDNLSDVEKIKELAKMREDGILTDEEFEQAKKKILNS